MKEYIWICGKEYCPPAALNSDSPLREFAIRNGFSLTVDELDDYRPTSFAHAIEEIIDRGPSGIMVTAPAHTAISGAIDAAVNAGITVVTVAEDFPASNRLAHVGTDWFRMGSVLAVHIRTSMGSGTIIPVAGRLSANVHAAWSGLYYHARNETAFLRPDTGQDGPLRAPRDVRGWNTLLESCTGPSVVVAFGAESILPLLKLRGDIRYPASLTVMAIDPSLELVKQVHSGEIRELFVPRIEVALLHGLALLCSRNRGISSQGDPNGAGGIPGHVDVGFDVVTSENAEVFIKAKGAVHPLINDEIKRVSSHLSRFDRKQGHRHDEEGKTWAILNAIPDLIFQLDQDGTFISYKANRGEELYVPPEQFLGKNIHDVLPASLAEMTQEHMQSVLRTRSVADYDYELEIGGERLHFEARMTVTDEDDVIVIVRNITDRKRAEDALVESEERFRVAFKTSPDAISITQIQDGLYVDINDGFTALSGYTRDEIIGRTALELEIWHNPKDRDRLVKALRTKGYTANLEAEFRLKDGRIRTGLMSARIILLHGQKYILSVTRDITDWIIAEAALRESEERFRTVFETARDAIYIKDRDLKYIAVNPSKAELFDIPRDGFVGRRYEEVIEPMNAEHNREVESRVLAGEIVAEESVRIIAGEERIFHVIIVPLRIDGGEIIGLCGIAREITETRRLQKAAERAGRLETAGTIAGQVAHDFNNLLGPLLAYPDIIRESLPAGSEAHQLLNDMEYAAEQMADINQQLLTLGRRGHYSREPFNLNDIILQVVDRMSPANKRLSIRTRLAADLKNVLGGAAQIYRVVSNLVTNAVDAIKDRGTVAIRTENIILDAGTGTHIHIPRGEYILMTVADSGRGIPDDTLGNIFDPFFTTKSAGKKRGSGLGLSVVHSVVKDHGGLIDVDSTPGSGTTFRVYLPATDQQIDSSSDQGVTGGNERLLVVDDDQTQLDLIRTMLERLGYAVRCAESGEEALRILKEHDFDMLVLDMVMPSGIDGTETFRRARKLRRDLPALMMSGFAETKQVREALRLGARMFIRKPFSRTVLASAIRRELDRKIGNPAEK